MGKGTSQKRSALNALGRARGQAAADPNRSIAKSKVERRESGLDVLRRTGRLDGRQVRALSRYGRLWRVSAIEGEGAVRSSLAALEAGSGGGGSSPDPTALVEAEQVLAARRELELARLALGYESAMVAACDVVCGKEWLVGQITSIRREGEAVGTALWIASNLLVAHFAARDAAGHSGPV